MRTIYGHTQDDGRLFFVGSDDGDGLDVASTAVFKELVARSMLNLGFARTCFLPGSPHVILPES